MPTDFEFFAKLIGAPIFRPCLPGFGMINFCFGGRCCLCSTCSIIQFFLLVACIGNLSWAIRTGKSANLRMCILDKMYYCSICSFCLLPICGSMDTIVRDISDARLALFVEANLLLGNVQIEVIVSFAKEMHNCFVGGTLLYCFCVSEQILYSYPLDLSHPCCFSVQMSSVFNQKCLWNCFAIYKILGR